MLTLTTRLLLTLYTQLLQECSVSLHTAYYLYTRTYAFICTHWQLSLITTSTLLLYLLLSHFLTLPVTRTTSPTRCRHCKWQVADLSYEGLTECGHPSNNRLCFNGNYHYYHAIQDEDEKNHDGKCSDYEVAQWRHVIGRSIGGTIGESIHGHKQVW